MEFVFLSRFWGNGRKEGSRILILRSAIASTSHLTKKYLYNLNDFAKKKLDVNCLIYYFPGINETPILKFCLVFMIGDLLC